MCVAGAAIAVGSLSAAQARRPDPPIVVRTAQTTGQHSTEQQSTVAEPDSMVYLLTGTGLVAIGGVILVGGVAGLGGLDIPGGITMTAGRARLWARSVRRPAGRRPVRKRAPGRHRVTAG